MRNLTVSVMALVVLAAGLTMNAQERGFLGRWNLAGQGADATNVYWLEISQQDGKLGGMFLDRGGSPVPLGTVRIDNGELIFRMGTAAAPTGPEFHAKLEGAKLVGQHTLVQGGRRGANADPNAPVPPTTERIVKWIGTRPPTWPDANANGAHTYGTPVALFDGSSMDAWGTQYPTRKLGWTLENGVMGNEAGANNLVSKATFRDFKIQAEYKVATGSNSGIYLRGRYELQVLEDYGKPPESHGHMAIYGWTAPRVNASRPAGEWQAMEAILVANRVTVTLNGQRVHDNATIQAITGGALDGNETEPGPIMIQGDHTGVWVRKVVVTPITRAGK